MILSPCSKEIELSDLLAKEEFDIMFLNETDTKHIETKKDYQIKGYDTILPKISTAQKTVRILCLVKNNLMEMVRCCEELMSEDFPSIWLELNLAGIKKTIIGGCYREWNNNGMDSIPAQVERIKNLTSQVDNASKISN